MLFFERIAISIDIPTIEVREFKEKWQLLSRGIWRHALHKHLELGECFWGILSITVVWGFFIQCECNLKIWLNGSSSPCLACRVGWTSLPHPPQNCFLPLRKFNSTWHYLYRATWLSEAISLWCCSQTIIITRRYNIVTKNLSTVWRSQLVQLTVSTQRWMLLTVMYV